MWNPLVGCESTGGFLIYNYETCEIIRSVIGKQNHFDDEDDFNWEDIERITKNFKGSADDIEDMIFNEVQPKKKKKQQIFKTRFDQD